jgi:hypothetical protein
MLEDSRPKAGKKKYSKEKMNQKKIFSFDIF